MAHLGNDILLVKLHLQGLFVLFGEYNGCLRDLSELHFHEQVQYQIQHVDEDQAQVMHRSDPQ